MKKRAILHRKQFVIHWNPNFLTQTHLVHYRPLRTDIAVYRSPADEPNRYLIVPRGRRLEVIGENGVLANVRMATIHREGHADQRVEPLPLKLSALALLTVLCGLTVLRKKCQTHGTDTRWPGGKSGTTAWTATIWR